MLDHHAIPSQLFLNLSYSVSIAVAKLPNPSQQALMYRLMHIQLHSPDLKEMHSALAAPSLNHMCLQQRVNRQDQDLTISLAETCVAKRLAHVRFEAKK